MKDINKLNEIKEKIVKEELKLETLLEQKKKIETRITNTKNEIEKLKGIISQQQFNEMTDIFNSKGMDMEKVIEMLKNNNFNLNDLIPEPVSYENPHGEENNQTTTY